MKIAVIGPGAMGCLFAGYLKKGGLDVTLIEQFEDHVYRAARDPDHIVRSTAVTMLGTIDSEINGGCTA